MKFKIGFWALLFIATPVLAFGAIAAPVTVTKITSTTSNGIYTVGKPINVTLTFSRAITTQTGAIITIDTQPIVHTCVTNTATTPTKTLSCAYIVQEGDNSDDLSIQSVDGIRSVYDSSGNELGKQLDFGTQNLNNNKNIVIDTTPPNIIDITSLNANGTYGVGAKINITLLFSEKIKTGRRGALITLNTSPARTCVTNTASSLTNKLFCIYTVQTGDTSPYLSVDSVIGGDIIDAAGNAFGRQSTFWINVNDHKVIVIGSVAPTVVGITSSTRAGTYKVDALINVTLHFSQKVKAKQGAVITLLLDTQLAPRTCTTNTTSGFVNMLSCAYKVQMGDASDDLGVALVEGDNVVNTDGIALGWQNDFGSYNLNSNADIVVDARLPEIIKPYVKSMQSSANGVYTTGAKIPIMFYFSEYITASTGATVIFETGDIDSTCITDPNLNPPGTSMALSCLYVVQAGDRTDDLIVKSIEGINVIDRAGNAMGSQTEFKFNLNNYGNGHHIILNP